MLHIDILDKLYLDLKAKEEIVQAIETLPHFEKEKILPQVMCGVSEIVEAVTPPQHRSEVKNKIKKFQAMILLYAAQ
jgi:hypothetical protein